MATPLGPATRTFLIVGLAFSMLVMCEPTKQKSQAKQVEALFSALTSDREPEAAVLGTDDTGTVFERGYGIKDLRTGRKIDSRTNFRLASATKKFTAAAVMLLVRDGKLIYEESVTDRIAKEPD
jgi:CubicO group peptidase (beta-lactamase class C family)